MKEVQIIDTGIANIASVKAAFDRLGCDIAITNNADVVRQAEYVVLPGVGSFGAGMRALKCLGLGQVIVDRISSNAPLLGICLGMQLLCSSSEETPGVNGLGIINAEITRFPTSIALRRFRNWITKIVNRFVHSSAKSTRTIATAVQLPPTTPPSIV